VLIEKTAGLGAGGATHASPLPEIDNMDSRGAEESAPYSGNDEYRTTARTFEGACRCCLTLHHVGDTRDQWPSSVAARSTSAASALSAAETRPISVVASGHSFCSIASRTPGIVFTP
jgi:hypothetical protein